MSHPLRPQTYAHDAGCLDLNGVVNFKSLLSSIRAHLYSSANTRSFYVQMSQDMSKALSNGGSSSAHSPPPCDQDFVSFVADHWPTFRSFRPPPGQVLWGRVSKAQNSDPNEIEITNSLISEAEAAYANPTGLPLALYNLILTVVILHEVSHTYMKHLFKNMLTPPGMGPSNKGSGESGWLVERGLMGGTILASWDDQGHVGHMEYIRRVILERSGKKYIIDVNAAQSILESLGHHQFIPPSTLHLAKSPGGDFCARVTEVVSLPKREVVVTPIGLGFTSYLGSDRWETPP